MTALLQFIVFSEHCSRERPCTGHRTKGCVSLHHVLQSDIRRRGNYGDDELRVMLKALPQSIYILWILRSTIVQTVQAHLNGVGDGEIFRTVHTAFESVLAEMKPAKSGENVRRQESRAMQNGEKWGRGLGKYFLFCYRAGRFVRALPFDCSANCTSPCSNWTIGRSEALEHLKARKGREGDDQNEPTLFRALDEKLKGALKAEDTITHPQPRKRPRLPQQGGGGELPSTAQAAPRSRRQAAATRSNRKRKAAAAAPAAALAEAAAEAAEAARDPQKICVPPLTAFNNIDRFPANLRDDLRLVQSSMFIQIYYQLMQKCGQDDIYLGRLGKCARP